MEPAARRELMEPITESESASRRNPMEKQTESEYKASVASEFRSMERRIKQLELAYLALSKSVSTLQTALLRKLESEGFTE